MYNITEIKDQNRQDCLSMLYMYLSRSLVDCCGRGAEGAVREAVRRMGEEWGRSIRKKHVAAGVKTNLVGLYNVGLEYRTDPRMYEELIKESEEVRLWEIRTCPMADLWNKAGEGDLGLWYCEEFQHGLVAGYTDGRGQMNQSTFLTCRRDNHCRFSAYLRAANLEGTQRAESFAAEGESPAAPRPLKDVDFAEGIRTQFVKLYYHILASAEERYGSEGVSAVALGLRRMADVMVPIMKRHADDTLLPCDGAFLKLNFPIALNASEDEIWRQYDGHDARKIMQTNLLDRLANRLGLAVAV